VAQVFLIPILPSWLFSADAGEQPRASEFPIPAYCGQGDPERLNYFLISVTAKVAEFDDPCRARFETLQLAQSLIQDEYIDAPGLGGELYLVEIDLGGAAAAPLGVVRTGMIDQDAPHLLAGDGEEVRAILDFQRFRTNQAYVGLMDQGGGLQRVSWTLVPHLVGSNAMQFRVDQFDSSLAGIPIPVAHAVQQSGERRWRSFRGLFWGDGHFRSVYSACLKV
jgi:hypothetical protein